MYKETQRNRQLAAWEIPLQTYCQTQVNVRPWWTCLHTGVKLCEYGHLLQIHSTVLAQAIASSTAAWALLKLKQLLHIGDDIANFVSAEICI